MSKATETPELIDRQEAEARIKSLLKPNPTTDHAEMCFNVGVGEALSAIRAVPSTTRTDSAVLAERDALKNVGIKIEKWFTDRNILGGDAPFLVAELRAALATQEGKGSHES